MRAAAAVVALLLAWPGAARAADDDAARARRWRDLAQVIFNNRPVVEQPGWVSIDAPARAMDAALVPVTLHLADGKPIRAITLVVDENPSPVAARITLGPALDPQVITLRVRVDQYTDLHAVAETADGRLYASTRFIKASGGCSAPGSETPEVALSSAGKMKLRLRPAGGKAGTVMQADLLIRHPNFNGMQMDQATRLYTPARYLNDIRIVYNGQAVLHLQTDISLAADPAIGFGVRSGGTGTISVDATDTAHAAWHQDFPVAGHGS
jgi:sulfur-oxidizing protein SoxY